MSTCPVSGEVPRPRLDTLGPMLTISSDSILAVLSALLKRRFGHLLSPPPVSVDSGLKAIQLLRTEVFDVIFLDIQMPYLNGVDCAKRIRAADDGILPANSAAHIVAVTTAIGEEPEKVYRSAGMDGMIAKPVRFEHIQGYLGPLHSEALTAASAHVISPIRVDAEREVMPPMPPSSPTCRPAFYLPTGQQKPSEAPAIVDSGNFEHDLREQTRASLKRHGAAVARTGTVTAGRRSPPNEFADGDAALESQIAKEAQRMTESTAELPLRARRERPCPRHRLSSPAMMAERSSKPRYERDSPDGGESTPSSSEHILTPPDDKPAGTVAPRPVRPPTRPMVMIGSYSDESSASSSSEVSEMHKSTVSPFTGSNISSDSSISSYTSSPLSDDDARKFGDVRSPHDRSPRDETIAEGEPLNSNDSPSANTIRWVEKDHRTSYFPPETRVNEVDANWAAQFADGLRQLRLSADGAGTGLWE